jgi:hypothetical protein
MRARRAARLTTRADEAVNTGRIDEARQLLDEAWTLAPSLPDIAIVELKLRRALAPPRGTDGVSAVLPRRPRTRAALTAAATAAAVLISVVAWMPRRGGHVSNAPVAQPVAEAVVSEPALPAMPTVTLTAKPQPRVPKPPAHSLPSVVSMPKPPVSPPLRRRPDIVALPEAVSQPEGVSQPVTSAPLAPVPSLSFSERSAQIDAALQAAANPAASAADGAETAIAPVSSPSMDEPDSSADRLQEPLVRSTLNQYAAAYSTLDVDAAHRVWPGVDRAALRQAFDGLSSQSVTLDSCRVTVTGARARANCVGSTRWAPKVGAPTMRTSARRWDFELAKADEGWRVVTARVQNR